MMSDAHVPVPPVSVVLVSGGSRGLGLAIVEDLLSRDVKVATFARTVTPELTALVAKYEGSALRRVRRRHRPDRR